MGSLQSIIYSFVPLEMFYVKRMAKPKAEDWVLCLLTFITYSIGIATFVALFITQLSTYTTETSIQVSDISNSEWSCSMASVVTQSITLNGSSQPTEYYNLMSINELRTDCLAAFENTLPCANQSSILFTGGPSNVDYFMNMGSVSPAASTAGDTFYFTASVASGTDVSQTYRYDVTSSILTTGGLGTTVPFSGGTNPNPSSVAMSKEGAGFFAVVDGLSVSIMTFDGTIAIEAVCYELTPCTSMLLTNDNHHNVYTLANFEYKVGAETSYKSTLSLFAYPPYGGDCVNCGSLYPITDITTSSGNIYQVAIYCTHDTDDATNAPALDTLYVYYIEGGGDLYVYFNGTSFLLRPFSESGLQIETIQISTTSNIVYMMVYDTTAESSLVMTVTSSGEMTTVSQYIVFSGSTFSLIANNSQLIYTDSNAKYVLYQFTLNNGVVPATNIPLKMGYTGSTAGWYTCGSELVTTTLPANIYSTDDCTGNGISWQLQYTGSYFSTVTNFQAQAVSQAAIQCNATLYNTICDRIGSLPPYICSRKQYLPIFTVFATAIANSHLLTVMLFVLASVVLPRLGEKAPHNLKSDVEMRASTVVNPVADERSGECEA